MLLFLSNFYLATQEINGAPRVVARLLHRSAWNLNYYGGQGFRGRSFFGIKEFINNGMGNVGEEKEKMEKKMDYFSKCSKLIHKFDR